MTITQSSPEFARLLPALRNGSAEAMDQLVQGLRSVRVTHTPEDWRELCAEFRTREPELWSVISQCPMTRHASSRPRGYPGDAALLDFIYGQDAGPASELGRRIFEYTSNSPACRAVRARRDTLQRFIDEAATRTKAGRVLSLACGHAREALASVSVQAGAIEYLAMDQDSVTLDELRSLAKGLRVETQLASVRQWLKGEFRHLSGFDLAYASGLYDYLSDDAGAALSARLFQTLSPGGTLVIPNFAPDVYDVAYMECCMDWWLIYRDETSIGRLLADIDPSQVASRSVFREPNDNIVFLVVTRA